MIILYQCTYSNEIFLANHASLKVILWKEMEAICSSSSNNVNLWAYLYSSLIPKIQLIYQAKFIYDHFLI